MSDPDQAATIVAVVSAVFTAVAAIAALRSAKSAAEASRQAHAVERRTVLREVHPVASEVATEGRRIDSLLKQLSLEYQVSFGLAGQSGGAEKAQGLMREWEDKKQGIQSALDEAAKYLAADPILPASSSDELTLAAARLR